MRQDRPAHAENDHKDMMSIATSADLHVSAWWQGAIVSFTKALANMLMSTNGIRTNCVNPGPIWTVRGCLA
jgi:NAD(P)-dependent dehydrogenase (short-subunit alcohol dehydrogenase family)